MKKLFFLSFILFVLFSCSRNPMRIDVSNVVIDLSVQHFDKDLSSELVDSERITILSDKYGEFFKIFTQSMIWIGTPADDSFIPDLQKFTNDTMICSVRELVASKIDTTQICKELKEAFKHYKYYFPRHDIPRVVCCVSGFNQSIIIANQLIGISLDKFLGHDCLYYPRLGLPAYKQKRMNPENILPETMKAWALTEFPKNDNSTNLLSNIVYHGKIMYFIDAMLPEIPDTLKIGYSKSEMEFCIENENQMWAYLAEYKLLYSTKRMDVKRYIDDAPFTNSFSNKSPGRSGEWIGWQIVRAYMKKHPEVSLSQLMQNQNYQEILNLSGYSPS